MNTTRNTLEALAPVSFSDKADAGDRADAWNYHTLDAAETAAGYWGSRGPSITGWSWRDVHRLYQHADRVAHVRKGGRA